MDITALKDMLIDESIVWLPKVAGVLFIIILFYFLAAFVKRIIVKVSAKLQIDPYLTEFFAKASRATFILFGLVTALGTAGINVSALVAGLGLTGFALGFALKDTISNILSGVLILLYRPFKISDKIKISGFEGKVISVDLRYTKLLSEEGVILIPNSKCFTDPIVVYTEV